MNNKFDNMSDGKNKDGEIEFRKNKKFSLNDQNGKYTVLAENKFKITFNKEDEVYEF